MKNIYNHPKRIILIVWLLLLLLIYLGKIVNMIKFGYYKLFVSEFIIWFFIGSMFTYFLFSYFEKTNRKSFIFKFLMLLLFSFFITISHWLIIYFPVTYFTDMSWIDMMKLSNVFTTFYTDCFIISIWYFFYSNGKFLESVSLYEKEKLQLESNLKESQLNALKGQINPHFMFNSLNNIRGLILENPEKSREMITRLSEMLRYSLTKSEISTIALEEEIEMVDNFIAISKIQLEDRLKYTEQKNQDTLKVQIPPMIIQLLIENAVKHGIATIKNGGEIVLTTKKENDFLSIIVSNTGKLIIAEDTTKLGLKNIEQRLELMYGHAATFSLKEIEDKVVATILIPTNIKNS